MKKLFLLVFAINAMVSLLTGCGDVSENTQFEIQMGTYELVENTCSSDTEDMTISLSDDGSTIMLRLFLSYYTGATTSAATGTNGELLVTTSSDDVDLECEGTMISADELQFACDFFFAGSGSLLRSCEVDYQFVE